MRQKNHERDSFNPPPPYDTRCRKRGFFESYSLPESQMLTYSPRTASKPLMVPESCRLIHALGATSASL